MDFSIWPKLPILSYAVRANRINVIKYLLEEMKFDFNY
jgi:hypothetical protein